MVHIYSFDPGQTTGWAHLSIKDDEVSLFRVGEADHFEIGDMLRTSPIFSAATSTDIDAVFVAEAYRPNPRKSFAPWSLETIGLIRYYANLYSIPLNMYQPSEAKSLIKDDTLRRANLWTPGKRHANDAVICAVYYLVKERGLMTSCLIK